jgi:CRISPR/Cas system-associated endonuclease/helicase Cas3
MNIIIEEVNGTPLAILESEAIEIHSLQDAIDLIGNSGYLGAQKVVVSQKNLHPDFFDLKTKLAGDILQKFSNYQMQLAIIGEFSHYPSKSLQDFILESNKHGRINFVGSLSEAKEKLLLR